MSEETALVESVIPEGFLVPQDIFAVPTKYGDAATLQGMSGGDYLPRVQLCSSQSKVVKAQKAKDGDLIAVKGKEDIIRNFGSELNLVVLQWRPKAMHFTAEGKNLSYYNPKSPKFQEIEKKADIKPRPKNYLYGPEYLVYIPEIDLLASFHFNNPTMRLRASEMAAFIGRAATVSVVDISSGGNDWKGPSIAACTIPLNLPAAADDELYSRWRTQSEKFRTPPDEETGVGGDAEAVTDAAPQRAR